MIRLLIFLGLVVAASLGATWLIDNDGIISAEWMGWHIEASFAAVILSSGLIVIAVVLLIEIILATLHMPGILLSIFRTKNPFEKGLEQLTYGFAALAEGDVRRADKAARKSEKLLGAEPLALLLSAETARRAGDTELADAKYSAMLDNRVSEFMGLKGLLAGAYKSGTTKSALEIAEKAHEKFPRAEGVIPILVELYKRDREWAKMITVLNQAPRRRLRASEPVFGGINIRKEKSLGWLMRGKTYLEESRNDDALTAFKDAHRFNPEFLPANLALIDAYIKAGKPGQAESVLKDSWKQMPNAELTRRFMKIHEQAPAKKRLRLAEKLAQESPNSGESHMLIARTALDAANMSKAGKHIEMAIQERETATRAALRAELEEKTGNFAEAERWRTRAESGFADGGWVCSNCGQLTPEWEFACHTCASLETVEWKKGLVIPKGTDMKFKESLGEKPVWEEA